MFGWLIFGFLFGSDSLQEQSWWTYRDHFERAIAARKAQQPDQFLKEITAAHRLNPDHLMSRLLLVVAEVRHGSGQSAFAHMERIADMGLFINLDNPNFQGLAEFGDIQSLKSRLLKNKQSAGKARNFAVLPKPDAFPEGIAHDPNSGRLFVGSIHQRQIWMRKGSGSWQAFVTPAAHGLWSVLGLAVDQKRGWLWACSAAMPETKGLVADERGRSGVFAFNLKDGRLERRLLTPANEDRALGDLVIHPDGSLFVTDGKSGTVFRTGADAQSLEAWLAHPQLRSTQGICLDVKAERLFLADYSHGLFVINIADKRIRRLNHPKNLCLLGIDGLIRSGNDLIAIQNGIQPNRVVRWRLGPKGQSIQAGEVLLANDPSFDEPTLGTLIGNTFVFVANSQWSKYGPDHKPLPLEKLAEIELKAIDL